MANKIDIRHIDQRTAERYLQRGAISQKEYEKHLAQLPDLSEQAEVLELEHPGRPSQSDEETKAE